METEGRFPALNSSEFSSNEGRLATSFLNLNFSHPDNQLQSPLIKEEDEISESEKTSQSNSRAFDNEQEALLLSPTQRHDMSPKKDKPYVCENCGQTFTQISNLKRHERLHSGEKPFSCEACKKSFSTLSNLKQHQQTHEDTTERMKYRCQRCNKSYFYQSSLNKHLKGHDKRDAKMEFEKETQSLSPRRKGVAQISIQKSPAEWENSEEAFSDVSPTIKKIKRENKNAGHLTPATTSETLTNNQNSAKKNSEVDDEFVTQYNKGLSKMFGQFSNNFHFYPANPLLNVYPQYVSVSDPQPILIQNSIYNTLPTLPRQSRQYGYVEFPQNPQFSSSGYQSGLNLMIEPIQSTFAPIFQTNNQLIPNENADSHKPIYSIHGQQDLFQKPSTELQDQQYLNPAEGLNPYQGQAFGYYMGDPNPFIEDELEFSLKYEAQDKPIKIADSQQLSADPLNNEFDLFREDRLRRVSVESDRSAFPFSDRLMLFSLQREASDSNFFMREGYENTSGNLDFFN